MPEISGLTLSRAGAVLGSILIVLGVAFAFGFPYALMLSGVLLLAGSLLFVDVSPDAGKELRR